MRGPVSTVPRTLCHSPLIVLFALTGCAPSLLSPSAQSALSAPSQVPASEVPCTQTAFTSPGSSFRTSSPARTATEQHEAVGPSNTPSSTPPPNSTVAAILGQFPIRSGMVYVYRTDSYTVRMVGENVTPSFDHTTAYYAVEILEMTASGPELSAQTRSYACPSADTDLAQCDSAFLWPLPIELTGDLLRTWHAATLRFPLVVGDYWQSDPEFDLWTAVESAGPVDVPAGRFTDCFVLREGPYHGGAGYFTFCSGVGIVAEAGYHAPYRERDYWESVLVQIRTPQPPS